ncbi:MFS transporter [Methanoculleus bourgensis]|jgi:MFS family permease|uniref:MFS transporter n=1 Tax=Methanoculleus TaxID=45989 RepID=UPI001BDA0F1D|nr:MULTISPECIES: MFS transporter [Methanoculleus]MBT0733108.1 MFS transporter [Methanoculleus bourgensis]MDD3372108.1 MFS transporter [Methanoculleus bourgensis]GLI47070.1 MFS transporter [Methanoculleus bourgensis]
MMGQHPAVDRRAVYTLFVIGFFAIFSTTISKNPVLPLFSQALGAGDVVIGLVAAVSPLAGILFSFPVGVLSDHLGKRRLLIISGAIFLSAPLLYLFISDPLWLIPVRFFHGLATAILGPVIAAMIAVRFPEKKGEMLGQYSSATLIGRTLAPLVGGAIISFFVFYPGLVPYRMVYLAAAIAAVPVAVLILLYREETPAPITVLPFSAFRRSFVTFFTDRKLRATALVDMATYFAFGAFETFLPLVLLSRGMGAYQTGILFAAQTLIIAATKPSFGRISDRIDKRIQIVIGLFVLGCSVAAIPFASGFTAFLLISSLLALGMSLSTVATSAYVADVAQKEEMGASMGALSSIMDIGHSAGPLVTGIIVASGGFGPGFFASFLIAVAVCGFFVLSVRDPAPETGS